MSIKRIAFTPGGLEGLSCPDGKRFEYHYDSVTPGLWAAVYPTGTIVLGVRWRLLGETRQRRLGTWPELSIRDARALAEEAMKQAGKGLAPIVADKRSRTLSALCTQYMATPAFGETSESYRKSFRGLLASHAIPALGDVDVSHVTFREVRQRVIEPIFELGYRSTARSVYAHLRVLLNFAVQEGLIQVNPLLGQTLRWGLQPRSRYPSLAELRWLWSLGSDPWAVHCGLAGFVRFALLTACRPGEAVGLDVDRDVDYAEGTLTLRKTKSGVDRVLPLTDGIRAVLADLTPAQRKGFGQRDTKAAGARLRTAQHHAGKTLDLLSPHTIRAGVATHVRDHDLASIEDTRLVTGHAGDDVHRAVYLRGPLLAAKRRMLDSWEAWLRDQGVVGGTVTQMHSDGS